jgi:hypothetical protein
MGFPQYRQATPRNMIGLVAASMLDSNSVIDQEHGRVACRDAIRKIRKPTERFWPAVVRKFSLMLPREG